jgi:23S rRNA G2069 N7-methylase RlmK/C1962 C5-methylase RlmI
LERIDAIDIDGEFLAIAQEHLLEEQLSKKIVFHADSARYFLKQAIARGDTYDLVVLDAYN